MTSSSAQYSKILGKIACNRLQKELVEWQLNGPLDSSTMSLIIFKVVKVYNIGQWCSGDAVCCDEMYKLQVDFFEQNPMEAPQNIALCVVLDGHCMWTSPYLDYVVDLRRYRQLQKKLSDVWALSK